MSAISGFGEGGCVEWDDEWAGMGGGKPKESSLGSKERDLGMLFQATVYVQQKTEGVRWRPMDKNEDGSAGGPDHTWSHDNSDNGSAGSSDNSSDNSGYVRYYEADWKYNNKTGEAKIHGEIGVSKGDNKISANIDVNNKGNVEVSVSASGTW